IRSAPSRWPRCGRCGATRSALCGGGRHRQSVAKRAASVTDHHRPRPQIPPPMIGTSGMSGSSPRTSTALRSPDSRTSRPTMYREWGSYTTIMIRFIAVSAFLALVCVMQSAGSAAAEQKLGALDVAKDDLPIDRNRSHMVAITDKAGVLRFLDHRHAIMATEPATRGVYDPT